MNVERLKEIVITDEDISWVESAMGENVHFDQQRIDIIKNMDSIDVQAFPGSGKTTILVAKLAILAKKWPFTNMGICVLSHTNVAREEIESRLGNNEVGRKLLNYPHFIGTFHSFFDTYVSIPWLHSQGFKINIIDTAIVTNSRWNSLTKNTRYHLNRKYKDESICAYKGSIGTINLNENGDTKQFLLTSIRSSQEKGNFTFEEMLLYSKEALSKCDYISRAIQQRFPIVFVDEAQDTDAFQWELLNATFNGDNNLSIRQGYGDSNQAIYNYISADANQQFPRAGALVLTESKRFDFKLAELANTVAVSREKMHGTENEFSTENAHHTIFLFSKDKEGQVINEFGQLILDVFSDEKLLEYLAEGCHVVGMIHVKKEETEPKHFPRGIYDYWPQYDASKAKKNTKPRYLIEYFRMGLLEFERNRETKDQIGWISKGLRRLINIAKNENYISSMGNIFYTMMKNISYDRQKVFRHELVKILGINNITKSNWERIVIAIKNILDLFEVETNENVSIFLKWVDDIAVINSEDEALNRKSPNHYIYEDKNKNRFVDLEFGSIHSVKGRTHLATLVLETYYQSHNMKSILRYLCNTPPKKNGTHQKKLKCQYVAMTRARGLLCLAIPVESVDEKTQQKLMDIGWKIKFI